MGAWGGIAPCDMRALEIELPRALRAREPWLVELAAGAFRRPHPDLEHLLDVLTELSSDWTDTDAAPRPGSSEHEDLARIFEVLVTRRCLDPGIVLGRRHLSMRSMFYDITPDPMLVELYERLDGIRYWAPGTGGYGEGIRGWLGVEDTQLFALCLSEARVHDENQFAFAHTRCLVENACERGRGVLWGVDLDTYYAW